MSLCAIVLTACAPRAAQIITASRDSSSVRTERIVDTVKTETDSALLAALLECDSLGRVRLARLEAENGRLVAQTLELEDNLLRVQARAGMTERSREVIRSDTVRIREEIPVPYEVVRVENRLNGWQKTLCWIGVAYLLRTLLKFAFGRRPITFKTLLNNL